MLLTTHLMLLLFLTVWRIPLLPSIAFYLVFATIEATYLSSTATKVPTGQHSLQQNAGDAWLAGLQYPKPCPLPCMSL